MTIITGAGDVLDNIGPQTLLDLIGNFDGYGLTVVDEFLLTMRLSELQEERGESTIQRARKLYTEGHKLDAVKLMKEVVGSLKEAHDYCLTNFST